jgi:hypothetical protein
MKNYKVENISHPTAKKYNKLLELYESSKHDLEFLFIVDTENLIDIDESLFTDYIALMKNYDLACTFYAYNGFNNLFNGKHNPMARCTLTDEVILITRFPGTKIVGFNLEKIKDRRFDENLEEIFLDYFLFQLAEDKLIPFFGFFIDVNNPWEKIKLNKIKLKMDENQNNRIKKDRRYLDSKNINLTHSYDLDKVLKFIKEKQK